ncbi:MAG: hypothetical protein AABX29_07950 [Nanoarchaeota archaeon]
MTNNCVSIEILNKVPFFGNGDSLVNRLRKVSLRGFPNIKIYEDAIFDFMFLTPEQIRSNIYTPQPAVYQPNLDRVDSLFRLFKQKDIDILNLDAAFDFLATSDSGEVTEWTILPPVLERFTIPRTSDGKFNYASMLSEVVRKSIDALGKGINPAIENLEHRNESGSYDLINDGAHRVHYGYLNRGVKVLIISRITNGFPYYALPQAYSSVHVFPERTDTTIDTKIHILEEPAHKLLYRLFPSGGIKSGDVRDVKSGEVVL